MKTTRKILLVLLALAMLVSLLPLCVSAKKEEEKKEAVIGDVTGEGRLDAMDYMLVRSYLLKTLKDPSEKQLKAMDVDGNKTVNAIDCLVMKHAILTKTPIPDPHPYDPLECLATIYLETKEAIQKENYVDCKIRIVDGSGHLDDLVADDASIKIRGNSTSSGNKKPYNIKFSSKTDVLGMGKAKKWCLLANMFDKTMIRNKLAYDFAAEIGLAYTQSSTFADVYLNGKYAGCYQLCESVGTGSSRVDIDTDGNEFLLEYEPYEGYSNPEFIWTPVMQKLFGFNDPEEPTKEQRAWLTEFFKNAENALYTKDKATIEKYWDLDSFVNDYIVHEYFKNVDAQTSSTRYYIKGGKIYGGPVWDFDLSAGNVDQSYYKNSGYYVNGDSSVGWYCKHIWYDDLLVTGWFEDMVIARFKELQPIIENLTTDNELGKNRIDLLLERYGKSFEDNIKKAGWRVNSKDSPYERQPFATYEAGIDFLRKWLIDRNEWMKAQYGIK